MQLQMTQKEKFVYGFIAVALAFMFIEYRYEPVGITVDVGKYAANRISDSSVQATMSAAPKTAKVAKVRETKTSSPASGGYVVAQGETLYAISRKHGNKLDIKATCALNALGPDCGLKTGQRITLAMRQ